MVHPHAAGIDVGNESHFAAVPPDRDARPVREFGSWTADLVRMAEWLKSCGIETVALQSTGVYWMAAYEVLEQSGLEVYLVNARHTKNLPGRKSDVQESQWLMKLHRFGLLRNSFQPPQQIRAVRTVWRLRDRHVKDAGRSIQQMQKALTKMNVQLANVISDLSGVTGQAIVRAILAGQRDPHELAALRDRRIRASEEEIVRSLEGNWQDDVLFELRQVVEAYDFHQKQIAECDRQLERWLATVAAAPPPAASAARAETPAHPPAAGKAGKKRRAATANAPQFNLAAELERIAGVDLTKIDGIDVMTAQTVLAELGPDMRAWATENHFSSWLGLSPAPNISGGRVINHEPRRVRNRVAHALRMAASTLIRSQSYLGARYRHLRTKLGAPKAMKAMARHLACLVYRMLTKGQPWVDRSAQHFEHKHTQRELARLNRKASALGMRLVAV
jgi:transposase